MVVMGNTVDDEVVPDIAASGAAAWCCWPASRSPASTPSARRNAAHRPRRSPRTSSSTATAVSRSSATRPARPTSPAGYAGLAAALARRRAARTRAPSRATSTWPSGEAAAATLLAADRPDAIVCANDEMALGVHLAAEAAGLRVPDDLAVTGWDDVLAARFAGLTTVRQPMRELGATAARWLHRRIAGTHRGPGPPAGRRTRRRADPARDGSFPRGSSSGAAADTHPHPRR